MGNVAKKARARDTTRLPQNSASVMWASIAPGMTSIRVLSMISMTMIETVSEAKAS